MDLKNYVYDYIRDGQKYELKKIRRFLELLGNPQNDFFAIHISGTNGKGSTSTYLEHILHKSGMTVGKFTSPHLVSYNERIRVDCQNISDQDFAEIKPIIDKASEKIEKEFDVKPSFFEIVTAIAYYYFSLRKVDVAVVEVGLGGRLDATNTLDRSISVVTNVAKDHTGILGKRLENIAYEKMSILKKGSAFFTAEKRKNIYEKFRRHARIMDSEFYRRGEHFRTRIKRQDFDKTVFDYYDHTGKLNDIIITMPGRHQVENASLAIRVAGYLNVSEQDISDGIRDAKFPGRLEIVSREPLIIMDGAHNQAGMKTLTDYIDRFFKGKKVIFLSSILRDKDGDYFFSQMARRGKRMILTGIDNKRMMAPSDMKEYAGKYFKEYVYFNSSEKALLSALNALNKADVLIVTGSLYLLGEIKRQLTNIKLLS